MLKMNVLLDRSKIIATRWAEPCDYCQIPLDKQVVAKGEHINEYEMRNSRKNGVSWAPSAMLSA